ncbi:MAG: P-II family nitrogen regulator [Coriobacteriaceae bacterium]|nr:P-II family nitrogen regulator [Coriobacteriaceae bacterium]
MRELIAIIRPDKVNPTKLALAESGFPAFTCLRCLGRGKKGIDPELLDMVLAQGELPRNYLGENMTEASRLIAKRAFIIVVEDDQVKKAVTAIVDVNQTGSPGDGRIFVLPIAESYRVSTGEASLAEGLDLGPAVPSAAEHPTQGEGLGTGFEEEG